MRLGLPEMTGKGMVMLGLQDAHAQILLVGYIYAPFKEESPFLSEFPGRVVHGVLDMSSRYDVVLQMLPNVCFQTLRVHNRGCASDGFCKRSGAQRSIELFSSEHGSEVLRVLAGEATIPPFRVDVIAASQRIGFGVQLSWPEADNHIKLRQIFRPVDLASRQG